MPLFIHDNSEEDGGFLSFPFSFGRHEGGKFLNIGTLLFHRYENDEKRLYSALFPLTGWDARKDGTRFQWWVLPLVGYDRNETRSRTQILLGAIDDERTQLGKDELRTRMLESHASFPPHEDPRTWKRLIERFSILGAIKTTSELSATAVALGRWRRTRR